MAVDGQPIPNSVCGSGGDGIARVSGTGIARSSQRVRLGLAEVSDPDISANGSG